MVRKILGLLFCAYTLFATGLLYASESLGRKPLVECAYRMFPVLLINARESKSFMNHLGEAEKRALGKIIDRMKLSPPELVYSREQNQFIIPPDIAPRLMWTPVQAEDAEEVLAGLSDENVININEVLLQDPSLKIDFVFLLKLFVHELGHKIGEKDLGMRDRLAQMFENHLRSYLKYEKIDTDLELMIFSLPHAKVNVELAKVEADEIQPSSLLMLKQGANYTDLTSSFRLAMKTPTTNMRALWAELNKGIYSITEVIYAAMNQYMKPAMDHGIDAVNRLAGEEVIKRDEGYRKLFEVLLRELRLVEIHSVEQVELKESRLVSMKATFVITRTGKDYGHISINGTPMSDLDKNHPMYLQESYLVPMTIQLNIPRDLSKDLKSLPFHVQLRAATDYNQVAKVGRSTRVNGQVSLLQVKFSSDKNPKTVKMSAQYGSGYVTLAAKRVEKMVDGMYLAEFEIDPQFYHGETAYVVDALLINLKKTVFLDRLVTLSGPEAKAFYPNVKPASNTIVPHSVGMWGLKKGQLVFANEFDAGIPINLEFGDGQLGFAVNPLEAVMDFQLQKKQKIKEVRFHYMRTSSEFELDPEKQASADGSRTIKNIQKNETYEIVSIDGKDLEIGETSNGAQIARAKFQMPLEMLDRPREELQAYLKENIGKKEFMFVASPVVLEIVAEDLQTLRHYFKINRKPSTKCEDWLSSIAQKATGT